ncbi:MAG: UDP-N-acetyl-D-glucosamine 2-epimerase, UDP-hydrolysing [Parcubacteria group bacterium GW2011_GWA2_43_9b]|nr:MAG: UDP-N-acetyl-D-glucosamine 2-epimerase, UDP-hydrolysing [Parcubacteria group bacterium GW2011_GWA2_43_9b]
MKINVKSDKVFVMKIKNNKRKICFVITAGNHYSRSKLILRALQSHRAVDLQLVVGASALLSNYGDVLSELAGDGFVCHAKIVMTLEGGNLVAMAKTAGIGITEFATVFDNLKPDIVVVRGDRYEVLSAAVAAAYLNIPIAHIEGGDVTGTIDESVRHAVTKLAHIHFPTNEQSRRRIIRMGENPRYVFNVGCPGLEFIAKNNYVVSNELVNRLGVGDIVDINKPYLVVMQHSVTSEVGLNGRNVKETLLAVAKLNIPAIWFWPNVDAGTDEISKEIRVFREHQHSKDIRFLKYLPTEQFVGLLKKCSCLIGNSSVGIKESSWLGVPVVNIGTRQQGRMKADNVITVSYDRKKIASAARKQIARGPYKRSGIYFKKNTSQRIVDILSSIELYVQKKFHA